MAAVRSISTARSTRIPSPSPHPGRRPRPRAVREPVVLPAPSPLPAGLPREWYVRHNRRIKAMRLAIALLNSGVYTADQARNTAIRAIAEQIGVHPPSPTTCSMVRSLLPNSRAFAG